MSCVVLCTHRYAPAQQAVIDDAVTASPNGGAVMLPGIPFEVRWGTEASVINLPPHTHTLPSTLPMMWRSFLRV